ncbi:hypothetical protein [Mycoplasma sp. (ex Biomphalaria glabrata)]|uniref:hypothetical protein n=1 Tax=Mycoplasma sp. (ex Biomphalaria glabrata) TaxID=1749074 RepID=UPI000B1A812D|nr:hypothetical protein [Mycoplasma sp. (ex Biomphalaria glabrata)]
MNFLFEETKKNKVVEQETVVITIPSGKKKSFFSRLIPKWLRSKGGKDAKKQY